MADSRNALEDKSREDAIACARKVIALRFKNYGKIIVDNET